jgi:GNAT superfamily N-acetyltransferase
MIRRALPSDSLTLTRVAEATFRETFVEGFAIPYPPEDLAVFVQESYGSDAFAAPIASPLHAVWVAEHEGQGVGYALVGPCKLPHAEVAPGDVELRQLYLLRQAQGLGLGGQLLDAALAWMDARRPAAQWLGVWSGNARAQRIYAAKGFVQVGTYRFAVGRWLDDELILRRQR